MDRDALVGKEADQLLEWLICCEGLSVATLVGDDEALCVKSLEGDADFVEISEPLAALGVMVSSGLRE